MTSGGQPTMINKPSSPCTPGLLRQAGRGPRGGATARACRGGAKPPHRGAGLITSYRGVLAHSGPNPDEGARRNRPAGRTWMQLPRRRPMLHFDTAQMAAITQAHFFSRVAEFVREQTTVAAYRDAALDKPRRTALW